MNASNIIESIYSVLETRRFGGRIVSIEYLDTLKEEIHTLNNTGNLDDIFYRERLTHFQFTIPNSSLGINSIIITSAPQPIQRVSFLYKEKQYNLIIPPTYSHKTDQIVESLILDVIKSQGFNLYPTRLPLKLLAIHSGLARYGKNNVAYVEEAGSFNRLKAFFSDIPVSEYSWSTYKMLDLCENCNLCLNKCPTGAISPDRFIIRAERCLTFHNERLNRFPDWIEKSWHNCLIGCVKCQLICPANKGVKNWIEDSESFNEQETELLLNGVRHELTDTIEKKLQKLDLLEDFNLIPRNLYALIT
jgi:epoxyqueuosine reductase